MNSGRNGKERGDGKEKRKNEKNKNHEERKRWFLTTNFHSLI